MMQLEPKQFATSKQWNLQYAIHGDADGVPILFFHGFPGSHQQAGLLNMHANRHGFRLIAVDRPGYGQTTLLPYGNCVEYVTGVAELLDFLNVNQFKILAVSGGAPMAWVMASQFSEKVTGVGFVCGLATLNKETQPFFGSFKTWALRLRRYLPSAATGWVLNHSIFQIPSEKILQRLERFLSVEDKNIFHDPDVHALLIRSMKMARLQKSAGLLWDTEMFRQDWFQKWVRSDRLKGIPFFFWHGKNDYVLDHHMSQYMSCLVAGAQLKLFSGAGHYSLPVVHAEDILKDFL